MRAKLSACSSLRLATGGLVALFVCSLASAQFSGFSAATVERSAGVKIVPGERLSVPVAIRIRRGYHINSNQPHESYLIPTKLTWETPTLSAEGIEYPEAEDVSYSFSEKPLSVYSARIVIRSEFDVPASIDTLTELKGKFRFQACNDKSCLPPKTIDVTVPVLR